MKMKTTTPFRFFVFCSAVLMSAVMGLAQTWNSNAGGYNTGYGTVYGSFGLAQATQNIYNSMQINMQRTMMRSAMIKKWGLAAVEKAEREARAKSASGRQTTAASSGPRIEHVPAVPKNYGAFRPDPSVNTGRTIADALGQTPEEKQLYLAIYSTTKDAFEKEVSAKGWKNNLAAAFTFFIVSNATIYHGGAEPNEESISAIYQAINQTIDEIPEFAQMTNRDKQGLYNTLVGFAGIPIATFVEGQNNKDDATMKIAAQLAGKLMRELLKMDPDRISIKGGILTIG